MKGGDLSGALPIAYFSAIAVAFTAPGILEVAAPAFRDFLVLVVPMRHTAMQAMQSADVPLWTPDLFLGSPFLANYQSAVFYPPSLLVYLAPEPLGLSLFLAFHLVCAGLGVAKLLSVRERTSPVAALFGGTVYAAGGFFTSLLPLTNHLQAATWLPWLLVAGHRLHARPTRSAFLSLTVLLTLQLLCGAPETTILSWLLLLASPLGMRARDQTAAEAEENSTDPARRALAPAAIGLALGLCAIQLVPTFEYARQTDRAAALPFETVSAESIAPRSLQQLVLPHTFTDGAPDITPEGGVPLFWSLYLGVVPLAAIFACRPHPFWVTVAVLATLFALGGNLPLFRIAYETAPDLLGLFRYPGKFFVLTHLALAILAGRGFASAMESAGGQRRSSAAIVILTTIAAIVAIALATSPGAALRALGYELRPDLSEGVLSHIATGASFVAWRFVLLGLVTAILLSFAGRHAERQSGVAVVLLAVTAFELTALHRPLLGYTSWAELQAAAAPTALGLARGTRAFHYCVGGFGCKPEAAPGLGAWRGTLRVAEAIEVQALRGAAALVPNFSTVIGVAAVAGSDGLETRSQAELSRALVLLPPEAGTRLLRVYGVGALIGPDPLPFGRPRPAEVQG